MLRLDQRKAVILMSTRQKPFEVIKQLKEEKNAVILAHVYQSGDVQDISDFIGD